MEMVVANYLCLTSFLALTISHPTKSLESKEASSSDCYGSQTSQDEKSLATCSFCGLRQGLTVCVVQCFSEAGQSPHTM